MEKREINEQEVAEFFARKEQIEQDYMAKCETESLHDGKQTVISEPANDEINREQNVEKKQEKKQPQKLVQKKRDTSRREINQFQKRKSPEQPKPVRQPKDQKPRKDLPNPNETQKQKPIQIQKQQYNKKQQKKQQKAKEQQQQFKPIPVPPIQPESFQEPELRSIWTKIAHLQKIVGTATEEELELKTLQIFVQTQEYFSTFL